MILIHNNLFSRAQIAGDERVNTIEKYSGVACNFLERETGTCQELVNGKVDVDIHFVVRTDIITSS